MRNIKGHTCCYADCRNRGSIHIGRNGGDSHWICWIHLAKWNARRARFLAAGLPCEMQELGDLLRKECWEESNDGSFLS
jgi:hypothetical protein